MQEGDVLLLENVRFYKEEEKNDIEFSKKLSKNIDIFVNDAFGTAHRAHASTAGIADYVSTRVAGFLLEKELAYLAGATQKPARPFVAIVRTSLFVCYLYILPRSSHMKFTELTDGSHNLHIICLEHVDIMFLSFEELDMAEIWSV